CETACPSGVPYGHLLEMAREDIERRYQRPFRHRMIMSVLRDRILPYPDRLQRASAPVRLVQRLGWADSLARALPGDLGRLLGMLPPIPPGRSQPLPEVVPAEGKRRYRVGLLAGCV